MLNSRPSRICQNLGTSMSFSGKSSTIPNSPKPVNIFYIWYGELCRRLNIQPFPTVKPAKPKNETVLDFVADRIKVEEWGPILKALKQDTSLHVIAVRSRLVCKFLDEVDTQRKANEMKRRVASLYTNYILRSLVACLSFCVKRSQVLTCLELDGVPLTDEYFQPLLDALPKNKTLKILSLKHCPIRDYGCQKLCMVVRYITNIEVLNLSACGLGSLSAQYIAKLIRYQQIHRYCETWHASLRYEDPDLGLMTGLKRIMLNNNPNIGDEGLNHILNELDDDLWIKALDMQKCNITENISSRLIDVIDYSKSLEVADFRNNDQLCTSTLERIFNILKNKQRFGYECEFQWCLTATTLPYEHSVYDTYSCSSTNDSRNLHKSRSVPLKQSSKRSSSESLPIRQTKTFSTFPKGNTQQICEGKKNAKVQIRLQHKPTKRDQLEQENKKANKAKAESKEKVVKFDVSSANKTELTRTKAVLNIKFPPDTNLSKQNVKISVEKAPAPKVSKTPSNVEFVFAVQDDKEKTLAQSLFENILFRNGSDDSNEPEENIFEEYFGVEPPKSKAAAAFTQRQDEDDGSICDSNASLMRFVEEIKNNTSSLERELRNNTASNCGRNSNKRCVNGFRKLLTKVSPVS